MFVAIRYSYYQYGSAQGDIDLKNGIGYNCDWSSKSCASTFIMIPKLQIFNGEYKRLQASYFFHKYNYKIVVFTSAYVFIHTVMLSGDVCTLNSNIEIGHSIL